jgi:hypothetical protein
MTDDITKELAETLKELRTKFDSRQHLSPSMVRVDAILDRYVEPFMSPEPVITRVEVITDNGREYVNWEQDNRITTSLQDNGKTLKVFVNTKTTEEPKMPITKPTSYDGIYTSAERETSKQWATALSNFIDELGGDSPALWEWGGITPTPEKVVECLRELVDFHMTTAADNELDECCELISKRYSGCTYERQDTAKVISTWMRNTRRPQPTLKSQALRDFETVRKHSDLLPEILDTIENALKSIPE